MIQVSLFSSPDCCLCDDALAILERVKKDIPFEIMKKNIYSDKGLLIKYRFTIPVVREASLGTELNWPFSETEFRHWLAAA